MAFLVHLEHLAAGSRRNANTSAWAALTITVGDPPDGDIIDNVKVLLNLSMRSRPTAGPSFLEIAQKGETSVL
jgi:hypothetical protein